MGLFRVYPTHPTLFPKGEHTIYDIVDAPTLDSVNPETRSLPLSPDDSPGHMLTGLLSPEITHDNLYSAFSSPTVGLLMCWQYSGSNMKSASELNRLWTFVQDPQFDPKAQATFSHEREKALIEKYLQTESNPFKANHGWRTSSVPIRLPHEQTKWAGGEHDPSVPLLMVDGVHHRNITEIIRSVFEDKNIGKFRTPTSQ
ncbi:hypothetical protein J3R82DRAFT_11121 [Butyriboletus roseoflavus]|nr:hypothetical protein J3R82DRAFT_11121 [Butyriboletus roseoflavus]